MYVANDTVRTAFAPEEACGATMVVGDFPQIFIGTAEPVSGAPTNPPTIPMP